MKVFKFSVRTFANYEFCLNVSFPNRIPAPGVPKLNLLEPATWYDINFEDLKISSLPSHFEGLDEYGWDEYSRSFGDALAGDLVLGAGVGLPKIGEPEERDPVDLYCSDGGIPVTSSKLMEKLEALGVILSGRDLSYTGRKRLKDYFIIEPKNLKCFCDNDVFHRRKENGHYVPCEPPIAYRKKIKLNEAACEFLLKSGFVFCVELDTIIIEERLVPIFEQFENISLIFVGDL